MPEHAGRYSINKGLLGTTIGGGETLDSWEHPPDSAFVDTTAPANAPDQPDTLILSFEAGLPTALDGVSMSPLDLMAALAAVGGKHGVGRGIHLGNTILGLKGRIAFHHTFTKKSDKEWSHVLEIRLPDGKWAPTEDVTCKK